MLKKRRLGKTGLEVSEIGLGAWAIGGRAYGQVSEKDAIETVRAYLQAGGNLIDTARSYGSEKYIGQAISERIINRSDIVLVTKTHNSKSKENLPEMWRDLEDSLKAMKVNDVDVLMMHQPPKDERTLEEVIKEMSKMKEQGMIRHIGASIKGANVTDETVTMCRQYMKYGEVEVFELIYSMLRQKMDYDGIFKACCEADIGIIARTVLESGFLTGKYRPGHRFVDGDHRNRWKEDTFHFILEDIEKMKAILPEGFSLQSMAVEFVLKHSNVSTAIVGAKTPEQVINNIKAAKLSMLSEEILQRIKEFGKGRTEKYNYE